jgi:hypothetical protein
LVEHYSAEENINEFHHLVENGFVTDQSLQLQLMPLLQNLVSGNYALTLDQVKTYGWRAAEDGPYDWYYPDFQDFRTFISTQHFEMLNEKRVLEWAYAIENGARPVVITLTDDKESWCEFILDGHHKLWGYSIAQVYPWRLRICGTSTENLKFTDLPEIRGRRPYGWKYAFGLAEKSPYQTSDTQIEEHASYIGWWENNLVETS